MALVNPRSLVEEAYKQGQAIGAFNVDSLDMAVGVVAGAEAVDQGAIIQVTVDTLNTWGWEWFAGALTRLLDTAHVDLGLHLDHAKHLADIQHAIGVGFTSVMFDGSTLAFNDNVRLTDEVVQVSRGQEVMVEAELGHVGRDGEPGEWEAVTDPETARHFLAATEVDMLAVAIGTRHGHQVGATHMRLDVLQAIHEHVGCPLVLHGSSGVPDSLLAQVVPMGIGKVNVGTELRRIWWQSVERSQGEKTRKALRLAADNIAGYVQKKIQVLSGKALD